MKYPFFRFPVFSFSRLLIFTIAATLFVAQSVSAQVVDFPDPNLESAIRESLNIPDGNPITQQEILRLTRLEAWESGITRPSRSGICHQLRVFGYMGQPNQ